MDGRAHVIVCGVDGSAGAQLALEWAVDEAVLRGCTLRVVTAWAWDGVEALAAEGSRAAALDHARQKQDTAVDLALVTARQAPEVERLLPHDTPSHALCQAALDAELMVLGSHGHGMVHDKFVGSTSQRTIHHSSCPVVILPSRRPTARKVRRLRFRNRGQETEHTTTSL